MNRSLERFFSFLMIPVLLADPTGELLRALDGRTGFKTFDPALQAQVGAEALSPRSLFDAAKPPNETSRIYQQLEHLKLHPGQPSDTKEFLAEFEKVVRNWLELFRVMPILYHDFAGPIEPPEQRRDAEHIFSEMKLLDYVDGMAPDMQIGWTPLFVFVKQTLTDMSLFDTSHGTVLYGAMSAIFHTQLTQVIGVDFHTAHEVLETLYREGLLERRQAELQKIRRSLETLRLAKGGDTSVDPARARAEMESSLAMINKTLHPAAAAYSDGDGVLMRTPMDWVGWDAMALVRPHPVSIRILENLYAAGLYEPLVLEAGMMLSHSQQRSDHPDVAMIPLLMAALFKFKDRLPPRTYAAILFHLLFINPQNSIDEGIYRDQMNEPYSLATYKTYFDQYMEELERRFGILNAREMIREAVQAHSDLLDDGHGELPLHLIFMDNTPGAETYQTGQHILSLLVDFLKKQASSVPLSELPSAWDFAGPADHPLVRQFMEEHNQVISRSQRTFLMQLREGFISGALLIPDDPLSRISQAGEGVISLSRRYYLQNKNAEGASTHWLVLNNEDPIAHIQEIAPAHFAYSLIVPRNLEETERITGTIAMRWYQFQHALGPDFFRAIQPHHSRHVPALIFTPMRAA